MKKLSFLYLGILSLSLCAMDQFESQWWHPAPWGAPGSTSEFNDSDRISTLCTIQKELLGVLGKIQEALKDYPYLQQQINVEDRLNKWLTRLLLHLQSLSDSQTDRTKIDRFIDTYAEKEHSIGQVVIAFEQKIVAAQDPTNELSTLMATLSVEDLDDELPLGKLCLNE